MGAITFSGLASGLDTSAMVEQLVAIERSAADKPTARKANIETQKSIVGTLSASLAALATAARGMDLDSEIKPRAAAVSDSRVSVAASAGATPGIHDLRVKTLAASQITQSRAFTSAGAGVLGTGNVDITVAGVTKRVSWTATDTLDTIATKLSAPDTGVTASVLRVADNSYRLIVTANESGTAKAPTFVDNGSNLNLATPANIRRAAANSVVAINGVDVTRSSNTISDALPGLTLTLNSLHVTADPNARATISLDTTALTAKLQKLVDGFNGINAQLHNQLDYTGTKKGDNTLFGDSTLRGLQGAIATMTTSSYGTNTTLAAIGITRDKTGTMTLDATKLATAVTQDPDAVSKIFVTNGFATAVTGLADRYTQADGLLAAKTTSLSARQTVLQEQIDRINTNADNLQGRLEKQFSALEKAISNLKSQSSYLAGLFGS